VGPVRGLHTGLGRRAESRSGRGSVALTQGVFRGRKEWEGDGAGLSQGKPFRRSRDVSGQAGRFAHRNIQVKRGQGDLDSLPRWRAVGRSSVPWS